MQDIHVISANCFDPHDDDPPTMNRKHPRAAIANRAFEDAFVSMLLEMRFSSASMEDPIYVEFALDNLTRSRAIQSMPKHQPLNPKHLNQDLDRFFHEISTLGFSEMWAIHTPAVCSFGTRQAEL